MKKTVLIAFLLHFLWMYSQESQVAVLKINKMIESQFLSDEVDISPSENNPFIAFSIALKGKAIRQHIKEVYYKDKGNNWQLFKEDADTNEKNVWYAIAYLHNDIEKTQLKVVLKEPAQLGNISLHFYHPKHTAYLLEKSRNENVISAKDELESKGTCTCARPPTITRSTWCPSNNCPPNANPSATDVKFLIVHHTAGSNFSSDWAAVVRSIWDFHVNTRGWADIGYNFLLDRNGNIYEGREDDTRGAHFSGHNSQTSGMSLMGTFTSVTPTATMRNALEDLLTWKSCNKSIDPLATAFHPSSGLNLHTISGHRDGGSTECPGNKVYDLLPSIRTNVSSLLSSCTLGIDENRDANNYLVYPNPFTDKVTINTTKAIANVLGFQCYDMMGRLVFDKTISNIGREVSLDLKYLISGIYMMKIQDGEKVSYLKLVKE